MLTLAFPADINPLNTIEPTVLAVGQLLREVIIVLAEDHTLSPDDRVDLYRIALRRLTPTPALQHHLPAPADPRLRDVAGILSDDPADGGPWPNSGERSEQANAPSAGCSGATPG